MNKQVSTFIMFLFALAFFSSAAIGADTYDNRMPRHLSCEEAYRNVQWHDSPVTLIYENAEDWGGVGSRTTLTYDAYGRLVSSQTDGENGTSVEGAWEYPENPDGCSTKGFYVKSTWRFLKDGEVLGTNVAEYDYPDGALLKNSEEGDPFPVPDVTGAQAPEPTRECDETSVPEVWRDEPEIVVEGEGRSQSRITYDVHDRVTLVAGDLPLGYVTETHYEYFDDNYLEPEYSKPGACNYRERRSREFGRMLRGDSVVANYSIEFGEDGSITERTSEGGTLVMSVLQILAPLLGYETLDPENEEWLDQRFGERN